MSHAGFAGVQARFTAVDVRLGRLETDVDLIKRHLFGHPDAA